MSQDLGVWGWWRAPDGPPGGGGGARPPASGPHTKKPDVVWCENWFERNHVPRRCNFYTAVNLVEDAKPSWVRNEAELDEERRMMQREQARR